MSFKRNTKILFFLPSFEDGGAEETLISLANQLYKKKTKVFFVVGNSNGNNKFRIEKKINFINLNKDRLIKCFTLAKDLIDKLEPEVVITTLTHSNLFFCFLKYFCRNNFKLIIRETNITPTKNLNLLQLLKINFFKILKRIFYNNADFVIAINSKSKNELQSLGVSNNKIKILNNPSIKQNFIGNSNKKIFEKKLLNKKFILYVGRFSKHKNLNLLIDIFNNVQKKIDINLVLIGQGKEMSKLKNLVDNYNIKKKVFFLGYKFNPLPYMKKAKLYVSFSDYEGQPNSVIQSLGCGTSVIIKSFPGLNKKLKEFDELIVLNELNNLKAETRILKNIKKNNRKNFNREIIKLFGEKQFLHNVSKLIYD